MCTCFRNVQADHVAKLPVWACGAQDVVASRLEAEVPAELRCTGSLVHGIARTQYAFLHPFDHLIHLDATADCPEVRIRTPILAIPTAMPAAAFLGAGRKPEEKRGPAWIRFVFSASRVAPSCLMGTRKRLWGEFGRLMAFSMTTLPTSSACVCSKWRNTASRRPTSNRPMPENNTYATRSGSRIAMPRRTCTPGDQ